MRVEFIGEPKHLMKYRDLDFGKTFRICSERSTGAVYLKCKDVRGVEGMLELSTFIVCPPTNTHVEEVDSECRVFN